MRDARCFVWALALALAAPGCTLLTNGNQYVGSGVDGGTPTTDTGPRPDSGVDSGPEDSGVGNRPPILGGIGLDDYDPRIGQTLRAVPGPTYDPDGDTTTIGYQWYLNGSEIAGATSAALPTTGFVDGNYVRLEAWASDGRLESPRVTVGDVLMAPDTSRWRHLQPAIDDELPRFVWDEEQNRAIRFLDGAAWEYTIVAGALRISRLPANGTPPPYEESSITMPDPAHHRLLVVVQSDPSGLYALEYLHRGAEYWTRVTAGGTPPTFDFLQEIFHDPGTRRIWVVGGFHDSMGAVSGLYSLDVSSAGAESWSSHGTTGAPLPAIFGAAAVLDPTTPSRVYFFGGVTTPTSPSVFVMRDHALQLDLTAVDVRVTETTIALHGPSIGAFGAIDPGTGHAVIYGGFTNWGASIGGPAGISDYDLASGNVMNTPLTQSTILGLLTPSVVRPGHFTAVSLAGDIASNTTLFTIDDVTPTSSVRLGADDRPPGLVSASGRMIAGRIQVVSGTNDGLALQQQWSVDPATWRWTPLTTMGDAVSGMSPPFRYAVIGEPTGRPLDPPDIIAFGGLLDTGVLADGSAWSLGANLRWVERRIASGPLAGPRVGAVIFESNCGGAAFGFFGGLDGLGNALGDGGILDCAAPRQCTWNLVGGLNPGRTYAGVTSGQSHAYIYGGYNGMALDTLLGLQTCTSSPSVDPITTAGPPPGPRFGHSQSAVYDASGMLESFLLFGGEDNTAMHMRDDVYRFTFTSDTSGTWSEFTTPPPRPPGRARHLAFWDETQSRLIIIGGARASGGNAATSDVWELRIRP